MSGIIGKQKVTFSTKGDELEEELELEKESKRVSTIMYSIISLAVFSIVIAVSMYKPEFYTLLPTSSDAKDFESLRAQFGAFGDFFGGTLNPLLSFFTIVLLICSLRLQAKELRATRIELKRTRESQESLSDEARVQNSINQSQVSAMEESNILSQKQIKITEQQVFAVQQQYETQIQSIRSERLHVFFNIIRIEEEKISTLMTKEAFGYPELRQVNRKKLLMAKAYVETSGDKWVIKDLEESVLLQLKVIEQMLEHSPFDPLSQIALLNLVSNLKSLYEKFALFVYSNLTYEATDVIKRIANMLDTNSSEQTALCDICKAIEKENDRQP